MRRYLHILHLVVIVLFAVTNNTLAEDIGTPLTTLSVNETGASVYSLNFEVPSGGGLEPHIGIAYNSQMATNGIVGYGFNVTGISVITSKGKDKFHHGTIHGATYLSDSDYYLDGKRLVLQSGTNGTNGSIYTIEGDPYTNVTLHGGFTNSSVTLWFEVKTSDGSTYQYGNTADSRQTFTSSGIARCSAWYINKIEDKYSNFIDYTYTQDNLCTYPLCITYGQNSLRGRGITNTVNFTYSQVYTTCPNYFWLLDQRGCMEKVLSSVSLKTGSQRYREYRFTYNSSSDGSSKKYYRLASIEEFNTRFGYYNSITIDWTHLQAPFNSVSTKNVETRKSRNHNETNGTSTFLCIDVTGDGIGDIIRVNSEQYNGQSYTGVSISRSYCDTRTGNISYSAPLYYYLSPYINFNDYYKTISGGASVVDFDGDGLNDIIFPHYSETPYGRQYNFEVIYGCKVKDGECANSDIRVFSSSSMSGDNSPLFATLDVDGDGLDEIIYLEREKVNGAYNGKIIHYNDSYGCSTSTSYGKTGSTVTYSSLALNMTSAPKKMFTGDYNNDGLMDLIVLAENNYYIFYNNGGSGITSVFTNTNYCTGTSMHDYLAVKQGDINGDGLVDFVCRKRGDRFLKVAFNNGNSTFTLTDTYYTGRLINDESQLSLNVYDRNNDGLSDVVLIEKTSTGADIDWLYSSGNNLFTSSIYHHSGADVKTYKDNNVMLGDFDGDGAIELGNFSSSLCSSTYSLQEGQIYIYKGSTDAASLGKVSSITDGLGVQTTITYSSLSNPSIYTKGVSSYPVNSYTIPLSVVANIQSSGRIVSSDNLSYEYGDMKIHLGGKGILGFCNTTTVDNAKGVTTQTNIDEWDTTHWLPSITTVTTSCGTDRSTVQSLFTTQDIGVNNWYTYNSTCTETDYDGNVTTTERTFSPTYGAYTYENVSYGSSMYKTVSYDDFVYTGHNYLPETVTKTQKHSDDNYEYTSTTKYQYNSKGDATQIVEQYGRNLSLTTTNTYDTYGNVITTQTSGQDLEPLTKVYTYDASGRFVIEEHTVPASSVIEYTHDIWGNVLTKTDASEPTNELTTRYYYDNWGRLESEIMPDGNTVTYETGWETSGSNNSYYVLKTPSNAPWTKTIYDARGKEREISSVGEGGLTTKEKLEYTNKGQLAAKIKTTGNLTIVYTYNYDNRGRNVMAQTIAGGGITKSTSYSYGNRSVSETSAGRTYTKTFDAWGNVKTSLDPNNYPVTYTYKSNGFPSRISSGGAAITLGYDDVGNRTTLSDPDAGTTTYTYAAGGRLLSETDARGVQTVYQYDALGRVLSIERDGVVQANSYVETGYGKDQISSKTCNGNSVWYSYDMYGRVSSELRYIATSSGTQQYNTFYHYDTNGNLSGVDYPGGLSVTYDYDQYGYNTAIYANGDEIYSFVNNTGMVKTSQHLGSLTSVNSYNTYGVLASQRLTLGNTLLDGMNYTMNTATGNITSRQRVSHSMENFAYDNLDRLTSVSIGNTETMSMTYAANGNILSKTGLGSYTYDTTKKHAVVSVQNNDGSAGLSNLDTEFHAYNNRISNISDISRGYSLSYTYGPDDEKCTSTLSYDSSTNNVRRKVLYVGDYEHVETQYFPLGNCTLPSPVFAKDYYFLDKGIIIVKENGEFTAYKTFADNLGSVLAVYDENGNMVFDADYDAWGKQTVNIDYLDLHYGYTGHEMLPEVGLINMEGRMYDPAIARFLSPDNYVQMPDFTQSFNRYSYCINNPLKYTDPTGEVFMIDDAAIILAAVSGAIINLSVNYQNIKNPWQALGYIGVGALSGVAGYFTAGIGTGIISGIVYGSVATAGLSALTNGLNNLLVEKDFFYNVKSSIISGAIFGAISGGISGGVKAHANNQNIWTGRNKYLLAPDDVSNGLEFDIFNTLNETNISDVNISSEIEIPNYPQIELDEISHNAKFLRSPSREVPIPEGNRNYSGYLGNDNSGKTRYVGITKRDPQIRFKEHLRSGTERATLSYSTRKENMTEFEARFFEQTYINQYGLGKNGGQLFNKINSVSPKKWPYYGISK